MGLGHAAGILCTLRMLIEKTGQRLFLRRVQVAFVTGHQEVVQSRDIRIAGGRKLLVQFRLPVDAQFIRRQGRESAEVRGQVRVGRKERVQLPLLLRGQVPLDPVEEPGFVCDAVQDHRTISSLPMNSFNAVRPR